MYHFTNNIRIMNNSKMFFANKIRYLFKWPEEFEIKITLIRKCFTYFKAIRIRTYFLKLDKNILDKLNLKGIKYYQNSRVQTFKAGTTLLIIAYLIQLLKSFIRHWCKAFFNTFGLWHFIYVTLMSQLNLIRV